MLLNYCQMAPTHYKSTCVFSLCLCEGIQHQMQNKNNNQLKNHQIDKLNVQPPCKFISLKRLNIFINHDTSFHPHTCCAAFHLLVSLLFFLFGIKKNCTPQTAFFFVCETNFKMIHSNSWSTRQVLQKVFLKSIRSVLLHLRFVDYPCMPPQNLLPFDKF